MRADRSIMPWFQSHVERSSHHWPSRCQARRRDQNGRFTVMRPAWATNGLPFALREHVKLGSNILVRRSKTEQGQLISPCIAQPEAHGRRSKSPRPYDQHHVAVPHGWGSAGPRRLRAAALQAQGETGAGGDEYLGLRGWRRPAGAAITPPRPPVAGRNLRHAAAEPGAASADGRRGAAAAAGAATASAAPNRAAVREAAAAGAGQVLARALRVHAAGSRAAGAQSLGAATYRFPPAAAACAGAAAATAGAGAANDAGAAAAAPTAAHASAATAVTCAAKATAATGHAGAAASTGAAAPCATAAASATTTTRCATEATTAATTGHAGAAAATGAAATRAAAAARPAAALRSGRTRRRGDHHE